MCETIRREGRIGEIVKIDMIKGGEMFIWMRIMFEQRKNLYTTEKRYKGKGVHKRKMYI